MKRAFLLLFFLVLLGWASNAQAQCTGNPGPNQICGTGSSGGFLRPVPANYAPTFNVMASPYNAKCDSVTNDTAAITAAFTAAIAAHGKVYIPGNVSCYVASGITITAGKKFSIESDSSGANAPVLFAAAGVNTLTLTGAASGDCANVSIKNIRLESQTSGTALTIQNCLFFVLENVTAQSPSGIGLHMEGSANFSVINPELYGFPALQMDDNLGAYSGMAAGVFTGGQFTSSGGSSPAISIVGDNIGISFVGIQYEANGTNTSAIQIDGEDLGGNTDVPSIDFYGPHGESNYGTSNTGADFLIGSNYPMGHVGIYGGGAFGQGNGVYSQEDFFRVVSALNVVVNGFAATGFTRSVIRLESGQPVSYRFVSLVSGGGQVYSDANGVLSSTYTGDASNAAITYYQGSTATSGTLSGASYSVNLNQPSSSSQTVNGQFNNVTLLANQAQTGTVDGANSTVKINGNGAVTTANGTASQISNAGTATITTARVNRSLINNTGGGTITTATAFQIGQPTGPSTALTSTWGNIYGIQITDQNPSASGGGANTLTNPPVGLQIASQNASGAYAIQQVGSGIVSFDSPVTHTGGTFANLPSPLTGMTAYISDGKAANCGDTSCTTFGTTITAGGGALHLFAWYNGTNWTLMGK